jgi:hypothetical protein
VGAELEKLTVSLENKIIFSAIKELFLKQAIVGSIFM